ncbi:hypothetical protein ACWCP2_36725, partial [Streptomyces sp. NPDC002104]
MSGGRGAARRRARRGGPDGAPYARGGDGVLSGTTTGRSRCCYSSPAIGPDGTLNGGLKMGGDVN